jgi:eukaryotic-like serine/threonine-protein kinase
MKQGDIISHYKIGEKLGEGGMGVVYKAHDIKLDRTVALKFLSHYLTTDPSERERFYHEARAAAALTHPNIAVVHEIGEHDDQIFITMEFVEGQTLKRIIQDELIPIKKVLELAIQVCEGLSAAHEKDMVHRDIKSDNIMVTPKGVAKIMDFGLAKLNGSTKITNAGSTLGTAAYMSPEQAQGEEVDQRSDIFSFGIVLYELLTGKLPFRGEHPTAVAYSIINEEPQPIARFNEKVTTEIERIVAKALAKDKSDRYQHADDLLADLRTERKKLEYAMTRDLSLPIPPSATSISKRWKMVAGALVAVIVIILGMYLFMPKAASIDSIAVLPFENVGADPNTEYLSDGITEGIINSLSHVQSLRVIPRSTVFRYKGNDVNMEEIGNQLKVRAIVSGRIVQRGDNLNVQVELDDLTRQAQVWGERYDRKINDLPSVHEEIVKALLARLQPSLSVEKQQQISKRPTENANAYQLYLKGRFYWNKRSESGIRSAIDHFQRAIEKDPGYALAYTGLADSYNILAAFGFVVPSEAFPKAKAAVSKALEFDSTLAEAHTSLAFILHRFEWNWKGAENEYKRAITLNPSYATALHWYACLLITLQRDSEAIVAGEQAASLDPLSLPITASLGEFYREAGLYDKAKAECSKAIEMDSNFAMARTVLALVYMQQGMVDKALNEFEMNSRLPSSTPEDLAWLGYGYAKAKRVNDARKILAELRKREEQHSVPPLFFAIIHMGLGEKEETVKWLLRAHEAHDFYFTALPRTVLNDLSEIDPRCSDVIKRMGLSVSTHPEKNRNHPR